MRTRSACLIVLFCLGTALAPAPGGARGTRYAPACSWPTTLDSFNLAYPDTSADYWMTHFGAAPASRLVIQGSFPEARYFSFHAYDEAQRPVASIADEDIVPDRGANPYRSGARGGTYTIDVLFEPEPKDPEPNTIYAGEMENGARNPAGWVIYRIYIPDDPDDRTAGVPLPQITLVTADGNVQLPLETCSYEPPPAGDELDRRVADSNYPMGRGDRHAPGTYDPPAWKRFYGTDREFRDWCGDYGQTCDQGPKMTSGFLANQQIAYLYTRISREFGEVVVVRFRPPRFPDTRSGDQPGIPRDVRYWSLCQNSDATQRVVACSPDYQTVLDEEGLATFVISDPEDRPTSATRSHGVNWLPWGGAYYTGLLIYRHMLPSKSFAEAIQNIEEGTPPRDVMKTYMPVAAYCTRDRFDKGGVGVCIPN